MSATLLHTHRRTGKPSVCVQERRRDAATPRPHPRNSRAGLPWGRLDHNERLDMADLNQSKPNEPWHAYCRDCADRRRRGAIARFAASRSADAQAWLKRHDKH